MTFSRHEIEDVQKEDYFLHPDASINRPAMPTRIPRTPIAQQELDDFGEMTNNEMEAYLGRIGIHL